MSEDVFTDPADADAPDPPEATTALDDEWVDVRMTEPEEGEWNVDAVVVDGQVEYVDLQVREDLLAGFIDCLVDDVSTERAEKILTEVATRQDLDVGEAAEE